MTTRPRLTCKVSLKQSLSSTASFRVKTRQSMFQKVETTVRKCSEKTCYQQTFCLYSYWGWLHRYAWRRSTCKMTQSRHSSPYSKRSKRTSVWLSVQLTARTWLTGRVKFKRHGRASLTRPNLPVRTSSRLETTQLHPLTSSHSLKASSKSICLMTSFVAQAPLTVIA